MRISVIIKKLLIVVLLLSMVMSISTTIYANNQTLTIQSMYNQTQISGGDIHTDWLKVEILSDNKDNVVFKETFENYIIKEGFIQIELGVDESNELNPSIFMSDINWIKITVKEDQGLISSSIITMNVDSNTLYSNLAYETPTGNLFPDISHSKNSVVIVNEVEEKFDYITTENLLELMGVKNKNEINEFFNIEEDHENHVLIVSGNKYEMISTENLFEVLQLSEMGLEGVIPNIKGHAGQYLQANELGTKFRLVDKMASVVDDPLRGTINLFIGEAGKEKPIFLWNDLKGAYEAQPTSSLGFITKETMVLTYMSDEYKIAVGDWDEIDISNLLDNTDSQELSISNNHLIVTRLDREDSEIDLNTYFVTEDEWKDLITELQASINILETSLDKIRLHLEDDKLSIEGVSSNIDLSIYKDNTDSQQLSFNEADTIIMLENGGAVNLSAASLLGTDDQNISYDSNTNIITLEGSNPLTINLSDLQDNTDRQILSMNDGILNLTRDEEADSKVDLKLYLGNASTGNIGVDIQPYSSYLDKLSDDGILEKEYVEYGSYFINEEGLPGQIWTSDGEGEGFWGEAFDLSILENILSLTADDTSVDLSDYKQVLTFDNNVLRLSYGGGEIDFSEVGDDIGTDDQALLDLNLSENILLVEIEDAGNITTVNLESIDTQLTDLEIGDFGYIKMQPITTLREDFEDVDLVLATNITNNITNIGVNSANIVVRDDQLDSNVNIIASNVEAIGINADVININNEAVDLNNVAIGINTIEIGINKDDISNNSGAIDTNTLAIATNISNVEINAENISANEALINNNIANIINNDSDRLSNSTIIGTNISRIDDNVTNISTNSTAIANNASELETQESIITANKEASELVDIAINTKIDALDIEISSEDSLILSTEQATPVDLSHYKQQLSFVGNILTLTDAGSIDFGVLGTGIGTDDQKILELSISNNELYLELENSIAVDSVNLSSIDTQLNDDDIASFGYIKIGPIASLSDDLEASDDVLEANITNMNLAYSQADDVLNAAIRADFGLVDTALQASINLNIGSINDLEIAYKEEDIAIREAFEMADTTIQADVIQNKLDSDTVDDALRVSINNNLELMSSIEIEYQLADEVIQGEFGAADMLIQADIEQNKLDREAIDEAVRVSINSNVNTISNVEIAYQEEDAVIREEFASSDQIIQADVDQNKLASNATDAALGVSVNNNLNAINSLVLDYQASDAQLRNEFQSADITLNSRIDELDISKVGDELSFTEGDTVIDLSLYRQTLSFANNEIKLSGGVSINLSSIDTNVNQTTVDAWAENNGYLKSLASASWNDIDPATIPEGFRDGIDNDTPTPIFVGNTPGLVPAVVESDTVDLFAKYLKGDGTWESPLKDSLIEAFNYIKIATTATIADGAVTTDKIYNAAVVTNKIAAGAITGIKFGTEAITSEKIASNSVTTDKFASNSITNEKVNSINWEKVSDRIEPLSGWISSSSTQKDTLVPVVDTVLKSELYLRADGVWFEPVQAEKIDAFSYLKAGGVTTDKIDDENVTSDKVTANAVTTIKLASDAVTTDKFEDGAITTDKIAPNAITTEKIASNSITNEKVNSINWEKISDRIEPLSGWISSSSTQKDTLVPIVDTVLKSELYLRADGVWSEPVQTGKIDRFSYLKAGGVTTDKIDDQNVTSDKIKTNAVTTAKIAPNAITTEKLASDAVTTDKFEDDAITTEKFGNNQVTNDKIDSIAWDKVKGGPNKLSSGETGMSLVPPSAGYESKYLRSDGNWVNPEHSHSNLSSTDHPHEFATLHFHTAWENNHDHDHLEKKSKHVNSNPYALNNHSHKHESSGNANFDGNNYYLNGNGGWTEVPSGGQDFGSLTKTGENMRFGNNRSWIDYGMANSHYMYGHWGPWVEYATHCEKPYSHYICVKIYATRYNSPMFNIGSAGLTSASDKRLKENIKTIENALYKIKSIRGVYYKKKLKRTEDIARLELGVIAQEVQPYIPEIVVENMGEGKEDYLMVSYERLVPVLIEAVKELRKEKNIEVENMSNKIEETSKLIHEELDELEKENKEILNQMEELKKRINKLDKTYTMN